MKCEKKRRSVGRWLVPAVTLIAAACGGGGISDGQGSEAERVRVAYLPNLSHAQPMIGLQRGTFQEWMGQVSIEERVFNAGPSIIEAIFGGAVDIAYVGPVPAVNGYIRSEGQALRVIAGAVSGGASLVVRSDSGIEGPEGLAGKRIASPQLGNSQDIALRSYLADHGLKSRERGGSVRVIPAKNPDILSLFLRKELDGAWVPEPWATRLVEEAQGRILMDERELWPEGKFSTALLIVRKRFLDEHPQLVGRWLEAHVEVTRWIDDHPEEAQGVVKEEISRLIGVTLEDEVIAQSFSRLLFVYEPLAESVEIMGLRLFTLGFIRSEPDLTALMDLAPLNDVLAGLTLPSVN